MLNLNFSSIKGSFAKDGIGVKLLLLLLFFIVYALTFSGVAKGVVALFGVTDSLAVLKITQFCQALGMFVLAALSLAFLVSKNMREYLSLDVRPNHIVIVLTIACIWLSMPLVNFIGEWNASLSLPDSMGRLETLFREMEDAAERLTLKMLVTDSFFQFFLNIVVMALLPAVGEELFFRGVMQNSIERSAKNEHVAVWITAAVFSFVHFQFFGFVPRLLLGAFLGYLLCWSRSLIVPMVAHFVNNATIVTIYYMYSDDAKKMEEAERFGCDDYSVLLISALAFIVAAVSVWKRSRAEE